MLPADLQHTISQSVAALVALSRETSAIILPFYQAPDLAVVHKENNTPLTQADLKAHQFLREKLPRIINAPVISEEDEQHKALGTPLFWLIDPIDGTKSFVEKTEQFCICIALIFEHRPVLSLIYAPLSKRFWFARLGGGSFVGDDKNAPKRLFCRPQQAPLTITAAAQPHQLSKRMHTLAATLYGEPFHHLSQQSALKFCHLAEGNADLYLKPSNKSAEWDIAAGDLILHEAGGGMLWLNHPQSALLTLPTYGTRPTFTNPPFLAFGAGFSKNQIQTLADKMCELMN